MSRRTDRFFLSSDEADHVNELFAASDAVLHEPVDGPKGIAASSTLVEHSVWIARGCGFARVDLR